MGKIFDHKPSSWQDLENMVLQVFQEMRYKAERNFEAQTVRGKVKIDVYAVNEQQPIPTIVLCECKHWNKSVDQNVVYGFRSICNDIGAHFGIIISKKGFQAGAETTRESTNIHLLDFDQFQETFFDEWRHGVLMSLTQMYDKLIPIMPINITSPINTKILKEHDPTTLFKKYSIFWGDHRYTSYFIENQSFPIELTDPRGVPNKIRKIEISSHREYFEIAKQACDDACKFFNI